MTTPLELPGLVMRSALLAAGATLVLALALGVWRTADDIGDEVDSAIVLAHVMSLVVGSHRGSDQDTLAALAGAQRDRPLRHLELRVMAQGGRLLLGPPPASPHAWPLSWLVPLHQKLMPPQQAGRHSWPLARPDGTQWTVTLSTSRESERVEALGSLIGLILLLLTCITVLLLVMQWRVRRSLQPLSTMVQAISHLERNDVAPVSRLPAMPIRELEAVAGALRHLAAALEHTEQQRRLLSRKVLTLQEDERLRLARELHDEMGQQLTALRVDASWLAGALGSDPRLQTVASDMASRCALIQADLRGLLARLRPLGALQADGAAPTLGALIEQLRALVQDSSRIGGQATACRLELRHIGPGVLARTDTDTDTDTLDPTLAHSHALAPELVQTVYRIAQEALTNVARHARAQHALLIVTVQAPVGANPGQLMLTVCDDGIGVPDAAAALRRGNGMGGMQERAWAAAGELSWHADTDRARWPGLCLQVRLPLPP